MPKPTTELPELVVRFGFTNFITIASGFIVADFAKVSITFSVGVAVLSHNTIQVLSSNANGI